MLQSIIQQFRLINQCIAVDIVGFQRRYYFGIVQVVTIGRPAGHSKDSRRSDLMNLDPKIIVALDHATDVAALDFLQKLDPSSLPSKNRQYFIYPLWARHYWKK